MQILKKVMIFAFMLTFYSNASYGSSLEISRTSGGEFQLAKVHWLPDYISGVSVDGGTSGKPGENKGTCQSNNYLDSIPKYHTCKTKNIGFGIKCYHNCYCAKEYSKSSCPEGFKAEGECFDVSLNKPLYKKCVQQECSEVGLSDKCAANEESTEQKLGGKTCYQCQKATCETGGFVSEIPNNNICQKVTYKGNACYKMCRPATCQDGGFETTVPKNNTCEQTTYKGNSCYTNCRAKTCEDENYLSEMPEKEVCTSFEYAGNTCYKNCRPATCQDGNYVDKIPENNVCDSVTYKGNSCYRNCRKAKCSDGGFVDSIPSGKTCSRVNYKGNTCYEKCECTSYVYNQTKECGNLNCKVSGHQPRDHTKWRQDSYCYNVSGTRTVYITPNCNSYGVSRYPEYPRSCLFNNGTRKYQSCRCDTGLYDSMATGDRAGNCHKDGWSRKRTQVSRYCSDGYSNMCSLCYHSVKGATIYISDGQGKLS